MRRLCCTFSTRVLGAKSMRDLAILGMSSFSNGRNFSVRDQMRTKSEQFLLPKVEPIDPPQIPKQGSMLFITSSGDEEMIPRSLPPPKQGRLDALKFTKESFKPPKEGEEIQVGHVVGRGIEQFAGALPPCMQDLASGSIGKHYREDVPELMKLPATDQNLALLACVETVHWNQESQSSGNRVGSSMSAAERFAILKSSQNLDNAPPGRAQGAEATLNALLRTEHAWEPVAKTANLTPEAKKLFADISSQVAEMAPAFAKNGVVDVKKLGDAVTECSRLSEGDPKALLKALKEKNADLLEQSMKEGAEPRVSEPLVLKSGKTLTEAMGKPYKAETPKLSVSSSNRL